MLVAQAERQQGVKASEANAWGEELENPSATSPLASEDR